MAKPLEGNIFLPEVPSQGQEGGAPPGEGPTPTSFPFTRALLPRKWLKHLGFLPANCPTSVLKQAL